MSLIGLLQMIWLKNWWRNLFSNDDIIFLYEDSGNVIFLSNEIGSLVVDIRVVQDNYLKISIVAVIKNPEILRFVSDYLKTKRKCKYAVKK